MLCIILILSTVPVSANENNYNEWYELTEEEFTGLENDSLECDNRTLYLVDVQTTIAKLGSGKIGILANVYCSDPVKTIKIDFVLQKKSGSSWKTVGTGTASDTNVATTAKSVTATGVAAGTYRAQATARVTDKYGYSEQLTSTTGSITMS